MAIVSHTVETTTQSSGTTHNIVRMLDSEGTEYMASFFLPSGASLSDRITTLIASTENALAEDEFEEQIGGE